MDSSFDFNSICKALRDDDHATVRELLAKYPQLKAHINDPIGPFDSPAILSVCSREMLDVLLVAGADINKRSNWWAGGFGLLHSAPPDLARYAISRGATLDAQAAARLGMLEELETILSANPSAVNEPGPDGQRPLHFASSVQIAELLLNRGAEIDAVDIDHESTAAQYMLADRQEVARYLVSRGCKTDLLMAAALGDRNLARKHLEKDPNSILLRVNHQSFPMRNHKSGGTIYQWVLGWYVSAPEVAKKFGHDDLYEELMKAAPAGFRLATACLLHDEQLVNSLAKPEVVQQLSDSDRKMLAHAARNNDAKAVALMVKAGFPTNVRGQHQGTPLHWAAWHGNSEMLRSLLNASRTGLEDDQNEYKATPMQWVVHGSQNGWHKEKGNYPAAAKLLLEAGAKAPPPPYPEELAAVFTAK